jgi:adenine deaminase
LIVAEKGINGTANELKERIKAARGESKADLVIKGAQYLDVFSGKFVEGDVAFSGGTIVGISESYEGIKEIDGTGKFIVPGFIDAHVHIESSMMTPSRFQQAVLPCGTTAVIWDPHEIANVKGSEGIQWALDSSEGLDLDVFVMVPSCVPSTSPAMGLETSGAELSAAHLRPFRDHPRVLGLAEMMNFPGLLFGDDDIMTKLTDYKDMKRDGHCPGLTGKDLNAYGVAGIHSCHESTTLGEAQEKLMKGIHVLVREGSCAKDADELLPIIDAYSSATVALCSDDRNPADIEEAGHINCIINKGLISGMEPVDVFRSSSFAPARAYGLLDRGAIAPGYKADAVVLEPTKGDWKNGATIIDVYKEGKKILAADLKKVGDQKASESSDQTHNNLRLDAIDTSRLTVAGSKEEHEVKVIGVIPRQILSEPLSARLKCSGGSVLADLAQDVLKIAVFERHHGTNTQSVAFVKGFNLKSGAIATSINHDSHNVITIGSSDELMVAAVNRLREIDGGIVVVSEDGSREEIPLPLGGLMTDADPEEVTKIILKLKAIANKIGCELEEPFLQLSFLALPVIPALKITDKGLIDVTQFKIVPVLSD